MTHNTVFDRPRRTSLAGVPLDYCDINDAIRHILHGRLASGGLVVTPNASIARQLATSPIDELKEAADLWLVDGWPVAAILAIRGDGTYPRATGSDLLPALATEAVRRGRSVVILGAGGTDAAQTLQQRTGSALVYGADLPFAPTGSQELVDAAATEIRHQRSIVFLCLGFPKQEFLAMALRQRFPECVFIGVGAAAQMLAGTLPRAPRALQSVGMEWAWRVAQDPKRLARRYLHQDLPWLIEHVFRAMQSRITRGSNSERDSI